MASSSSIEWTEATWNPVTGCSKVSPGCKYCYAERFAKRLQSMGNPRYHNGFKLTLHHDLLESPLSWKSPKLIFVNSMSDLFHEEVPVSFIKDVFRTMEQASQHTFQILTKRSQRLLQISSVLTWPSNVWVGVSVESKDYLWRAKLLSEVPASVRFVSCEPLLGPISGQFLENINWVIVGGESGPGARPMNPQWAREIRAHCLEASVPFFFKQW